MQSVALAPVQMLNAVGGEVGVGGSPGPHL